jgi:CheY-like chemotaxis protein
MNETNAKPPRVLVADDDPNFRFLARKALEKDGLKVTEAENGRQALSVFERSIPDIVILDIKMPEMDGIVTCRKIRELPGCKHIPILMITGMDDVDSINQTLAAGATDFVTKPINWLVLGFRVHFMLKASREVIEKIKGVFQTPEQGNELLDFFANIEEVPPIDLTIIANIRALERELEKEFLVKLIRNFLNSSPKVIQSLRNSNAHQNIAHLQTEAANYQSQSACLGAMRLASLCKKINNLGSDQKQEKIDTIITDIEVEFCRVKEELMKELNRSLKNES